MRRREHACVGGEAVEHRRVRLDADAGMQEQERPARAALNHVDPQAVDRDRSGIRRRRLVAYSRWHFPPRLVILCEIHFIISNMQIPSVSTRTAATARRPGATGARYRNQAAQRVLSVLTAFSGPEPTPAATTLARRLGMNKNMVHRALTALAADGYVARDISGTRYRLRQHP